MAEEQRRTGVSPYGDAIKELQRIAEVMVKERLMGSNIWSTEAGDCGFVLFLKFIARILATAAKSA